MGLERSGTAGEYFSVRDVRVLQERRNWLAEEFAQYAGLLPGYESIVAETVEWASKIGTSVSAHPPTALGALRALGESWEPDFVWMFPDDAGVHRLVGGVVCFPSSWALSQKLGCTMSKVHEPVPGLNEALDRQIETFLRKLEPGVIWRRENWGLSRDANLNHHPSRPRVPLDENVTADNVWLRMEHQMLFKLPRTLGILFGIRVEVVSLSTVIAVPEAADRMAHLLSTMSDSAARYKGLWSSRNTIVKLLRIKGLTTE